MMDRNDPNTEKMALKIVVWFILFVVWMIIT